MNTVPKTLTISILAEKLRALGNAGKRIVLCHGVFDLLHIGHIRYLRQAAELGDVLVVTVTPNRFVDKGPHRPAFNEHLRLEAVASLDCVTFAAINEWPTAEQTLRLLKPHVYAKGAEFKNLEDPTGKIAAENAVVLEIGAQMCFVDDVVFSSSNLINRYMSTLSEDCQDYLRQFRQRHSLASVIKNLERMRPLKVLVVGDMILDEYVYCSAMGVSSKDPALAVQRHSHEVFAGGAAAIANHVSQHVEEVTLCTVMGEDGKTDFVQERLSSNVIMRPVVRPASPTLCKSRILDGYSLQKLIEVYHGDLSPLTGEADRSFCKLVEPLLSQHDLVIAADFGNGCISSAMVDVLGGSPYLCVNTQANAGNRGLHTISRYPHADFISLASHEIVLEYRNSTLSTGEMMEDLQKRLHAGTVLVTEGRKGCAVLCGDFVRAPSFASNVVDRVGAGDALFSITALGSYLGFSPDLLAFIGNIAGSLAVESIGNAKSVGREAMYRYITSIMK